MGFKLARDDRQSILQVGSYLTETYQNIASGGTITMAFDTVVRLVAVDGDAWISRGTDEGTGAGLFLGEGSEITMLVYKDEVIYVNDATVNAVAVAK